MIKTITKFAGSTILATLLLSGCGSSSDNNTVAESTTEKVNKEVSTNEVALTENEATNYNETAATLSALVAIASDASAEAPSRNTNGVAETAEAVKAKYEEYKAKLLALKIKISGYKESINNHLPDSLQIPDLNLSISTDTVIAAATKLHDAGRLTDAQYEKFIARSDLAKVYVAAFFDAMAKLKALKASLSGTESNSTVATASARNTNSLLSDVYSSTFGVVTDPVVDAVGGAVSDGIVSAVNVDVVTDLTADAFRLVLKSDGLTVTMIDMAIGSETITRIMVDVMKDNWDLTEPMVPMITNAEDTEFAEKFTYLAGLYDNMIGKFVFAYIDAPMYDAVTLAMANPSTTGDMENTNLDSDYKGVYKTTSNMGKLMADIGVDYFVKPNDSYKITRSDQPDLYAGNDAFARLMLDVNNSTTNERLFYTLFSEAKTTNDFVATMQQVKDKNSTTATFFMDNIFLGAELASLKDATDAQKEQAMKNCVTIITAMFDGYKKEGLAAYSGAYVGFAGLVPFNRYKPYAQAFAAAGYQYIKVNGLTIPGGSIGQWIADKFFPSEVAVAETQNSASQAQARYTNAADDNATSNSVLTNSLEWIKAKFSSYTAWLSGATTWLTENTAGQTIAAAFDELVASVKTGMQATFDDLVSKGHDIAEAKIQVIIADENYTLPAFNDMNLSIAYIKSVVKTTALGVIDDPAMVRKFSENERVQGVYNYVNGQLETNRFLAYIPTWMTKLDWIELPANIDGMPKMKLAFKSGSADIYILSDNADAVDLQTNVLGNQVLLTEVALEDSPIVVDETNSEYSELHVYKFTIHATDLIKLDAILAKAGEYLDNKINGVAVDASDAVVEPTADTNTSN